MKFVLINMMMSQIDPVKTVISPLSSVMYEYGGWGLSAILMLVVWKMAKYIIDMAEKQRTESRDQYKQLIETLTTNKVAMESLEKALTAFGNKIDKIEVE